MDPHETHLLLKSHVDADHRELMRELRDLQRALESAAKNGWPARQAEGILNLFWNLVAKLQRHFQQEEEGGYLEEALALAPHLSSEASVLEQQHAPLLARLAELQSRVARLDNSSSWEQVLRDFSLLAEAIRAHEHQENKLLATAFNVDLDLG